jgi:acetoin utilization deacetylase AcuC-like enzyme
MLRDAFRVGFNPQGAKHHAHYASSSGFCVFNDVAVASRLMQAEWSRVHRLKPPLRVAIIDLDVHQGNGTANIFAAD